MVLVRYGYRMSGTACFRVRLVLPLFVWREGNGEPERQVLVEQIVRFLEIHQEALKRPSAYMYFS